MNILKTALLYLLLLTGPAFAADSPPVIPPDSLNEALPVLQAKYIDFKALNYKPGDRLGDLIARSEGRITLVAPDLVNSPVPIITAALPEGIIYWRLATFTPKKDWVDLAGELRAMIDDQHAVGAILDLRSNTTPDDYAGAAQVMSFFVPRDTILLKFLTEKNDAGGLQTLPVLGHEFNGPIIVLTDSQTTGAAETLADCLRADGALVVGGETPGRAAIFDEQKLASGQILRFVTENVSLADGVPLWGHPIIPDIPVDVDARSEKAALVLIKDNHIDDVIQESAERHRLSEASLVQGQDPEWDQYLTSLEDKPVLLSLPVIHDVALVRALDSLKAIRLSERASPPQTTVNASLPASTSIQ